MSGEYFAKNYIMSAQQDNDKLRVVKCGQSEWCNIENTTNNSDNGKITIRSKAIAEQLHFMLGQMLGINS